MRPARRVLPAGRPRRRARASSSASLELYLDCVTSSRRGKCVGRAQLTIEISVFIFSGSVTVTCERKFAGSNGDPTLRQLMGFRSDLPLARRIGGHRCRYAYAWRDYCELSPDRPRSRELRDGQQTILWTVLPFGREREGPSQGRWRCLLVVSPRLTPEAPRADLEKPSLSSSIGRRRSVSNRPAGSGPTRWVSCP